ncbi:hypothetical protein UFOVP1437_60 [uncultured Caudovirales phage]|uniref:Uncharacterized protein n=1 Tax=uncultured Caudovirales phage TaxID=2100421 RepID=A0A6J7XAS3_9CAUD|nr:hypothetical protein UFOVP1437_60 [uncultured Caudovirales phage]CAB5228111.1 hypothetical protein UFOVP1531_5 [uncultured Caudovirales phage]
MANLNAKHGAIAKHMRNGSKDVPLRAYYVKSDYATALYIGDPVSRVAGDANATAIKLAAGAMVGGAEAFGAGALQKVERATNGDTNAITGFIQHIGFSAADASCFRAGYKPASTEAIVFVADHPDTIFEIQASAACVAADVGKVTNLTGSGGSTVTGLSSAELDSAALATGNSSYQLRVVGISGDILNNDVAANNVNVLVQINNHTDVDVAKAGV